MNTLLLQAPAPTGIEIPLPVIFWLVVIVGLAIIFFRKQIISKLGLKTSPSKIISLGFWCGLCIILYATCQDSIRQNQKYGAIDGTQWVTPNGEKIQVYHMVEEVVKKRLKSPSTADFPSATEFINHIKSTYEGYEINSWVDSQNSFGATVRTYFSVTCVENEDGKWSYKNLIME